MMREVDVAWWHGGEWEGRAMRAVLAARDIGCIFRFLHGHGWSWSAIAGAAGLTDNRVRELARDQRRVVNYEVFERIAAGLHIPREHMGLGYVEPAAPVAPGQAAPVAAAGLTDDPRLVAVRHALTFAAVNDGGGASSSGQQAELGAFQSRIVDAWADRARSGQRRPLLVLVGGFAGSGKSEFSQFLAATTGWALLDKDILTRPLTESMLTVLGADPNDRHTPTYQRHVRPLEYRSLLAAALANLTQGVSSVATAPFLSELPDKAWLARLARRCAVDGADLAVVWVDTDVDSMHTYLQLRDAARDTWKLNHWDDYLTSVDLSTRPGVPHVVIDNSRHAALALGEQAQRFAELTADAR